MVTSINYNNAKEVNYVYNATGDLVQMTDWLGTTTFEVDLLHQLKSVTDHKGNVVTYDYDSVGNQTAIHYPDGTTATYDYDLVKNQTKVTECDGSETTYTYDGMGRVTEMHYPNGWVEYYTYDSMGRILAVDDTHPSEKPAKTQKHTYEYDANGNLIYEYMRGNGTGQAKNETLYTYDALNRLVTAHDNYGNSTRTYTYDSLGNLTYETGDGSHNMDYTYNNLNQLVTQSDDGWKTYTASSYDNRGNLVLEEYHKNKKTVNTIGQYFYDETNKMVRGINAAGEESLYSYNGLGALVENTWKIAQNGYGYHGVNADTSDNESTNGQGNGNSNGNSHGNNGNGNVKKISTVIKQFVPDYTTETYQPLTEHEVNGLDYRYVYSDKARLSVVVQGIENGSASVLDENGELHAYYHCDYLGTTDYLTSAVSSKVISWTSYNEWGEITHNAVLNCGARELDLVKLYATHDYDAVLNQFYAKARFYDADNRRFTAMDPILDPAQYDLKAYVNDPMQLVQYLYVKDNAVIWIDPLGLAAMIPLVPLAKSYGGNVVWNQEYGVARVFLGTKTKTYTATSKDSDGAYGTNGTMFIDPNVFCKDFGLGFPPIPELPTSTNDQASIHPKYSNYPNSTGSLLYEQMYYGIYVPKSESGGNNSNRVPSGYTLKKAVQEQYVGQFNLWTFLAGGGVSISSAYTANNLYLNSAMAAADTLTSFFKNCTNAWLQISFYQKPNTALGKAVIRYGFRIDTLELYAGSHFMLIQCSSLNSPKKKMIQEQFAKDLGASGRYDIKVSFDSARKSDYYMFYMYLTASNQWKLRIIKYPGDKIEVINVDKPQNGALLDIYDINYDADARLVSLLENYLKTNKIQALNVDTGGIYGEAGIYPSRSGSTSM